MRKVLSILLLVVLMVSGLTFAAEEEATFTIVHTNDTHGRVKEGAYDGMGFAKVYTKIKELEAQGKELLILDAGDTFHGVPMVNATKGEALVDIMNTIGYDGMTVGNHDFNHGQEQLLALAEMADFPIVSANIKTADGSDFIPPYTMVEIDGLNVAIVGMTSPETSYKTHPKNVEGITFADPIASAREALAAVEDEADFVIGLFHIGLDASTEVTSEDIANAVTGYDIIVDGHSHDTLEEGKLVNGTMIVMAGEYDKALGIVDVTVADGEVTLAPSLFTKDQAADTEEAPEILAIIEAVEAEFELVNAEVVGETSVRLVGEREVVRAGESNLGNLITDAMLDMTGADVAITNGGGIRASIEPGTITRGDVVSVLPFGNYIVTKEVPGADILMAIEHGIDSYPSTKGAFPHVAGLSYTFDPNEPAGARITKITVGGEPLDIAKTYVLATNDFMAAGGDDYTMFADDAILGEYDGLDEAVAQYIAKKVLVAPETEGRIEALEVETNEEIYTVVSGDVLWKIADKYDMEWEALSAYNTLENPHMIFPGDEIRIPLQ